MSDEGSAPTDGEIEVSVFGRGIGECIVCHLGNGQWIIVDSLKTAEGSPVALEYLRRIGVDLKSVRAIVLTHWHDDHVRGAAEIVRNCSNASVVLPIMLCRDEFHQVISQYGNVVAGDFGSGVDELLQVLAALGGQKARRHWAMANNVILEGDAFRVDALSPSHEDVEKFLVAITEWVGEGLSDQRLAKPPRNDTSVAVVIRIVDELLLLGGDLEVRGALSGWQAVHELAWRDRGRAVLYKVAHHGSITSEYAPVWDDLLIAKPLTVLAPYNRGKKKLPSPEDVERIGSRSGKAYSASTLTLRKGSRQNHSVDRTLSEAKIRLLRLPSQVGQVRLRKHIGDEAWSVELYQSACELADIAA